MTHPIIDELAAIIDPATFGSGRPSPFAIEQARGKAIAVLRRLREPDEGMRVGGGISLEEAMFNGEPGGTIFDAAGLSFTAAIDSLLPEEKGTE